MKDDEKIKVQDDKKDNNILTFGLSSNEFFHTARCKSAKEIWNMLEVTHEGTTDVRRARNHTLVFKYEAFRMKNGETISELQTRFTYIVNHLLGLGKTFEDEELKIKNLNCLTRTWEPKVTTIKESKNLATMTMEALFGKLLAYEHELTQLSYVEETKKERKGIALKFNSSREEYKDSSNIEEDAENFSSMVRKFGIFLRKSKDRKFSKSSNKIEKNNNYTCFKCGKQGHIKSEKVSYLP